MNKILLNLLIIVMASNQINAQKDILSAFQKKWDNSRNYLIELAETMPEDKFDFRPTERQMSFQEQLLHIRKNMVWISESYFADESQPKSDKIDPKSKAEFLAELRKAFDNVSKIIENVSPDHLSDEVKFFNGPRPNSKCSTYCRIM